MWQQPYCCCSVTCTPASLAIRVDFFPYYHENLHIIGGTVGCSKYPLLPPAHAIFLDNVVYAFTSVERT